LKNLLKIHLLILDNILQPLIGKITKIMEIDMPNPIKRNLLKKTIQILLHIQQIIFIRKSKITKNHKVIKYKKYNKQRVKKDLKN